MGQIGRRKGVRKQESECFPPGLGFIPGHRVDVGNDQVAPVVVVDHVAAVGIDEVHPLGGAFRRHQLVFDQPVRGGLPVDVLAQVEAGNLVVDIVQTLEQREEFVIAVGLARVQAGEGKQGALLESDPFIAGKGQLDPIIGGSFRNQRLRAEQRIEREFDPVSAFHEVRFEQTVVSVVSRIALVTAEIHGPMDENGQVRVHLDQALRVALIPVVAGPGLVVHVLQREAFVRRQVHVGQRATATLGDGGLEDLRQLLLRDDELASEILHALGQRSFAGKQCIDLLVDGLEMRRRHLRRDRVVEEPRFRVEIQRQARHQARPSDQRGKPLGEALGPNRVRFLGGQAVDLALQFLGRPQDFLDRPGGFADRVDPLVRPEIGVDVGRVMGCHRQRKLHVALGNCVDGRGVGAPRFVLSTGRKQQRQSQKQSGSHGSHLSGKGRKSNPNALPHLDCGGRFRFHGRMLILFTDFGFRGPYVGEMKIVIESLAPGLPVIDLMHDAPCFNPRASAYLLAAMLEDLPEKCVVCGVVDPGVGSERPPVVYRCDQRWFVGPGNGLFEIAARRSRSCGRWRIRTDYEPPSASFHGRDIFAPIAARLALGDSVELAALDSDEGVAGWPDDLTEVIYIDAFGNAMTGIRAERVDAGSSLAIMGRPLFRARTFSDLPSGVPFWYVNSLGLVEIAVNQGSAAEQLGLEIGTPLGGF